MKKEDLKTLLNYYDDLYYNQDISEISDYEYDELKNKYIEEYGEYNYVPGQASNKFKKVEHTTLVSSLDKVQITDTEKLEKEIKRLWPVVIQPKMDGLTIVTYPDEKHVSRGNGIIGEDLTVNVNKVDGLGEPFSAFPVRSEVVMLRSKFEEINKKRINAGLKPFDNCRNAAAGMLRNLDSSKIEGLKAFAYNILFEEEEEENLNADGQINYLKNNGWNTVINYKPETIEDAINYINNFNREELDYDIDGLVIKNCNSKVFGQTEHHPLNAIAVKFIPAGAWTKITDVKWTVGRTGQVTPVIQLEPITINGSTITKATGHNFDYLDNIDLEFIEYDDKYTSNTQAYVIKANDVIPRIIKTKHKPLCESKYIKKITEPERCPICNSILEKQGKNIFCVNECCSAKIINRLIHLAERDAFNIEDLGKETAPKLVEKITEKYKKKINELYKNNDLDLAKKYEEKMNNLHPSFIYLLTYKDILSIDGFAEKSALKLYKAINKSLNIDFDKFLYGCGVPLIGKKAAKDIAEFYFNDRQNELFEFIDDYNNDFEKLRTLKGIGNETINSLKKYYDSFIVPFGEFNFDIKDIIPKKKATNQLTFVITGTFDIKRKEIQNKILNAGHKISSSVSSKTSYVLCGTEPGSKLEDAKNLNIPILSTLEELDNIL